MQSNSSSSRRRRSCRSTSTISISTSGSSSGGISVVVLRSCLLSLLVLSILASQSSSIEIISSSSSSSREDSLRNLSVTGHHHLNHHTVRQHHRDEYSDNDNDLMIQAISPLPPSTSTTSTTSSLMTSLNKTINHVVERLRQRLFHLLSSLKKIFLTCWAFPKTTTTTTTTTADDDGHDSDHRHRQSSVVPPNDYSSADVSDSSSSSSSSATTTANLPLSEISWGGKTITSSEQQSLVELRQLIKDYHNIQSKWLKQGPHDIELLRFLRARHGHLQQTWKMIIAHDKWRVSQFGAESSWIKTVYYGSPLEQEIFWLEKSNKEECATVVLRTQLHDGFYYNDDPKIYTGKIVAALEEGRERFGVGVHKQICILLDRAGTVYKNGHKKVDKLDMSVIPALIELVRHLHGVLMDNYPELLHSAYIAPASWFFSMCYKVTSRVMSTQQREKFLMIKSEEVISKLHPHIHPSLLPEHLGGYSTSYTSLVYIDFHPEKSLYPIDSKKVHKHKKDLQYPMNDNVETINSSSSSTGDDDTTTSMNSSQQQEEE